MGLPDFQSAQSAIIRGIHEKLLFTNFNRTTLSNSGQFHAATG